MKHLIVFFLTLFTLQVQAQKIQSFDDSTVPAWLSVTDDVLTVGDAAYPVYKNKKAGFAVRLKEKYYVYFREHSTTTITVDGTEHPLYHSTKGTPYIFVKGKSGAYYPKYKPVADGSTD